MFIEKTLGQLCELGKGKIQTGPFGSQLHQADYSEEGTPVVMPADIIDGKISETKIARVSEDHVMRLERHQLAIGDIVYGRRGDIGRQALITSKEEGWLCGTGCLRVTVGKKSPIDPEYLHLYLKMPDVISYIQNQAIGATMPNLNTEILKRIPIRYPEKIADQKKVIAVLKAYFDLIENNKKRIQILENMAEELYKEWFVRFRFPNWENTEFEKGVPKGWEIEKVSNLVDRKKFGRVYKEFELASEGSVPVIDQSQKNILGFHEGEAEHKASFESPMIIFGDHSCKMQMMFENFSLAENVIPLKSKGNISLLYLFSLIKDQVETTEYKRHWGELTSKKVLLAPISLQEKYASLIIDKMKLIENLKTANNYLVSCRDQLLPRLISGKLSVGHLDIQFPPSMQEQ